MTEHNFKTKMFQCSKCNYFSDRKFNLKRHFNVKHCEFLNFDDTLKNEQKVSPKIQKVSPNEQKVSPNEQKVSPCLFCLKCNKIYKTKRHLQHHYTKCKGVDELTCSKCMVSFTTKQAKYKHIKANNCKARSIIYARTPNVENITNNITHNINNNIQNIIQNNNFIINNFGSERIDHISHNDIVKILASGINTIPLYIEKKHFDKNFPENNNIKYTLENKCKVYEDDDWKEKDLALLSSSLIQENSEVLLLYCEDNDIKLAEDIQNVDKYEHIKNKLFLVNDKYNIILSKIKELIKNTKNEI